MTAVTETSAVVATLPIVSEAVGQPLYPPAQSATAETIWQYVATYKSDLLAYQKQRTLTTVMQNISTTIPQDIEEEIVTVRRSSNPACKAYSVSLISADPDETDGNA